jgi:Flp pilus assembly pilin Flp
MCGEQGQATVEWTALLLLVALVLVAAGHMASRRDGRELGTTLASSLTPTERSSAPPTLQPTARADAVSAVRRMDGVLRRAGRGAGTLWRRAWFACLVYERTRYSFRHPESRLPGYLLPYRDALRMINNCVSPVDLLRDVPELDPGLGPGP